MDASLLPVRKAALVLLFPLVLLGLPSGARADFHGACSFGIGEAGVDLADPLPGQTDFMWFGYLRCQGATSASLTTELSSLTNIGGTVIASLGTATASCSSDTDCLAQHQPTVRCRYVLIAFGQGNCHPAIRAGSTTALSDGYYEVKLTFDAAGPAAGYTGVVRCIQYWVAGGRVIDGWACPGSW